MELNNLTPATGSVKTAKRVGRGAGSGLGSGSGSGGGGVIMIMPHRGQI